MEETTVLLRELMSKRPETANVAWVNEAVHYLENYLRANGVEVTVESYGERSILYASPSGTTRPDYLLNAHLDVVPGTDDQFELVEQNGVLKGRGTHDCLGNAAVVAQTLIRCGSSASVGAVFTTDEEQGGGTTAEMVKRGYAPERMVIIVDGSGYAVITAQKGVLVLKVKAHGKACHSAEPWKGTNAIDKLMLGYAAIREQFSSVAPPYEWQNTMAPTIVSGGSVHNRVPDSAEMILNVRYIENTDADEFVEQLREVSGLDIECSMQAPPVFCDQNEPQIEKLREHMARHLASDIEIKKSNGATDARHFAHLNCPVAIIGIPGEDLHGANESADVKGLRQYETMLGEFFS